MKIDVNKEFTFCHHFFFEFCNFFLNLPANPKKTDASEDAPVGKTK